MKVSVRLHNRPDQLGRHKIYLRMYKNGKYKERATNIMVTKLQFQNGKIVNHIHAEQLNKQLKIIVLNAELKGLQKSSNYPDADFFKYSHDCIEEWRDELGSETIRQNETERNKVRVYMKSFKLSDIDTEWLKGYKKHLYGIKNKPNTVWKSFKFIRKVVRKAHKERIIEFNPFDQYDMPIYTDPKVVYLTKQEIHSLEEVCNRKECDPKYAFCGWWFLIGCVTGLRLGDQKKFNKEELIVDGRLILYTSKTGEPVSMPLTDIVIRFLDAVRYEPMHFTGKHYNELVREMMKAAGIKKHITVHIARHTFGVLCAASGLSIEVTAKLMGHKSTRTTAIYYKIANPRIDEEYKKISL